MSIQPTIDELIAELESRGLGWSLDHTGHMIEARVWKWPNVIGRYRLAVVEPLAKMLAEAMSEVENWASYPVLGKKRLTKAKPKRKLSA